MPTGVACGVCFCRPMPSSLLACHHVNAITAEVYEQRLAELRRRLAELPERSLLVVAHWGVLKALTGAELQPGELATLEVELRP